MSVCARCFLSLLLSLAVVHILLQLLVCGCCIVMYWGCIRFFFLRFREMCAGRWSLRPSTRCARCLRFAPLRLPIQFVALFVVVMRRHVCMCVCVCIFLWHCHILWHVADTSICALLLLLALNFSQIFLFSFLVTFSVCCFIFLHQQQQQLQFL